MAALIRFRIILRNTVLGADISDLPRQLSQFRVFWKFEILTKVSCPKICPDDVLRHE